ncbi:MAG: hypothetical protein WBO54_08320 [Thermoanaerobaculia bacterium]
MRIHDVRRLSITLGVLSGLAVTLLIAPPAWAQGIYLTNGGSPTKLYEVDLSTNETVFLTDLTIDTQVHAISACQGDNALLAIGRNSRIVARIDLDPSPPVETVIGILPLTPRVVQLACAPDGTIFYTDVKTEMLFTLDPSTCDATLATPCSPVLMGTVESALGAADVNIAGADIQFSAAGDLFLLTNGTGVPSERLLYWVDLSGGLPCPGLSCPATLIGDVATGENNQGLTALPDGRLIIASNDDHIYEVDPSDASLLDLGEFIEGFESFSILDVISGDLTALPVDCLPTFDFEMDGEGNPLVAGQIIDDEWATLGVTVSTNDPANHPLMIFNSSSPTGGDSDLGTPNNDFGGPGIGAGGEFLSPGRNGLPRAHVLIISANGDPSDPNDYDFGGTIDFVFDPPARQVTEVHVLDIDPSEGGTIKAFDADDVEILTRPLLELGNNGFQVVPIGAFAVGRLEITLQSTGAVSAIVYCGPCGSNFQPLSPRCASCASSGPSLEE